MAESISDFLSVSIRYRNIHFSQTQGLIGFLNQISITKDIFLEIAFSIFSLVYCICIYIYVRFLSLVLVLRSFVDLYHLRIPLSEYVHIIAVLNQPGNA